MSAAAPPAAKPTHANPKPAPSLAKVWPMIWTLVEPRRNMLALGFLLMAVNRVTGLVLPASTKWLIDDVIGKREVALLLLKGLSTKEIASVRATSERTIREQARSIYTKAGLTGRAALSAFFLEDLLAPIEGLE